MAETSVVLPSTVLTAVGWRPWRSTWPQPSVGIGPRVVNRSKGAVRRRCWFAPPKGLL